MSNEATHQLAAEIRALIAALIELALVQDEGHGADARGKALRCHTTVRAHAHPALLADIKLDGLWVMAIGQAESPALLQEPLRVSPRLPKICPLRLDELTGPKLDADSLAARIRSAAATG